MRTETARLRVDDLELYPGNPRRGNVELLKESLSAFGQYRPVVVQRSTMRVLAGNHTLRAARELDWEEINATLVDCDDDTASRIVLIDNRSNDLAVYDERELLAMLEEFGGDLELTGYADDKALIALLQRRVEADNVFAVGADHMLDEFKEISGQDVTDYAWSYARKVTVYLRDDAAIADFAHRLGIPEDELGHRVNYPLGWTPDDRRAY